MICTYECKRSGFESVGLDVIFDLDLGECAGERGFSRSISITLRTLSGADSMLLVFCRVRFSFCKITKLLCPTGFDVRAKTGGGGWQDRDL